MHAVWILSAHADRCDLELRGYRYGGHAVHTEGLRTYSRQPEPGSLEARHPGTARRLVQIMFGRVPYFTFPYARPIHETEVKRALNKFHGIEDTLRALPRKLKLSAEDAERFQVIADYIRSTRRGRSRKIARERPPVTSHAVPTLQSVSAEIQSALLELLVSTLFDGKKFTFHAPAVEYYFGPRPTRRAKLYQNDINREIDLLIERRNGRHLWVEVKNNAYAWNYGEFTDWAKAVGAPLGENISQLSDYYARKRRDVLEVKALEQLAGQLHAREIVGRRDSVDILWVSKFDIPDKLKTAIASAGAEAWPLYPDSAAFKPIFFQTISRDLGDADAILPSVIEQSLDGRREIVGQSAGP